MCFRPTLTRLYNNTTIKYLHITLYNVTIWKTGVLFLSICDKDCFHLLEISEGGKRPVYDWLLFISFYFIFYKTPENTAKKGKYYSTLELHQKMYFHWDEAALMLLCKYCWEFV